MATYMFEALNNAGEEVKDEIEAQSSEDAINKIREMGYYPTRVKEKGGAKKKFAATYTKRKKGR